MEKVAAGVGDVGAPGQAEGADRQVAEGREGAGAFPVLTWEESSPKMTSRTQWSRFSIVQCRRW